MSSAKRVRGVSVHRAILVGNTSVLIGPEHRGTSDHTHRWTIAVRSATGPDTLLRNEADRIGGKDDISYFIKKVTFKLHDTYPTPLRSIEKAPFEVTETGWGEFDIIVKIFFVNEAAEKPITFTHHLKLHPWPLDMAALTLPLPIPPPGEDPTIEEAPQLILSPVHSWQYEEVVFSEPTEAFYSLLFSKSPTPLPPANRHPKELITVLGGGGNFGEFSVEMETEEGARLDTATKETMEEIEALRLRLIGGEKDLIALRKEVEELSAAAPAQT